MWEKLTVFLQAHYRGVIAVNLNCQEGRAAIIFA